MADDIEPRIKRLEDREEIIYGFIDELRAYSKKLDLQHEEALKLIKGTNESLHEFMIRTEERFGQKEQMLHALTILQGDTLKLLTDVNKRMNGLEDRMNGK